MTTAELAELDYAFNIEDTNPATEHWMFDKETMALIDECDNAAITKE